MIYSSNLLLFMVGCEGIAGKGEIFLSWILAIGEKSCSFVLRRYRSVYALVRNVK